MPSSYSANISTIISIVKKVNPRTVLDIGIGWGKYGLLVREYLPDLAQLDGIEVWEPYVTKIQQAIYDTILISDVREAAIENSYELTLLIDVLEHFNRREAKQLLRRLPKPLLLATPTEWFQEDHSNPYERHRSQWKLTDFSTYSFEDYSNNLSYILLIKP